MSDNLLARLNQIASEILPDRQIATTARGEDYYVFEITGAQGARWALPPVWIDPQANDHQVKEKIAREFERAFHPDSSPDDLSVPNMQIEANHPKTTKESAKRPQSF